MGDSTTFLNLILTILSVSFLLLAGFAIPFLLQIWRTAKSMALTLQMLNQYLPGIMKNLEEITTNVSRTTVTVNRQVEEISLTLRRVQGVIGLLAGLEKVIMSRVRFPLSGTLRTSAALYKAGRVFCTILLTGNPYKENR